MSKKLLEITAEIVQAQATVGKMSPEEIELTLVRTFATLQRMQVAEDGGKPLDPGATCEDSRLEDRTGDKGGPMDSIQENKVVCLECGVEMRQLTAKHLGSHNLNPREYKRKWGLPLKQSLSAKSLSKARSKAARKRGLPANLVKFQEERKRKKAEASRAIAPQGQRPGEGKKTGGPPKPVE
ncbi:MAG TPA: MucR family transcriptional regulator [Syntrophobacter fumaroxidans]|nr:MucR family transcriptional regulator [Syntrophobacter fumaroxidans]